MNIRSGSGPVFFGDVTYQPQGVCGPRTQRDYQLVILRSGWLDLLLDGREIAVPPGSAILLSPGHDEHFLFSRELVSRHAWCALAPTVVPPALGATFTRAAASASVFPFGGKLATLLELGLAGFTGSRSPEGEAEQAYLTGVGLALLAAAAQEALAERPAQPHGDFAVGKAQQYLQREFGRALQLADIARAAGVSRQHLLKLFRERRLGTPMEYLYARRLEAAANWLAHTGLSITEIAEQAGFTNPYHFSRKFKAAYQLSPRQWRRKFWKT